MAIKSRVVAMIFLFVVSAFFLIIVVSIWLSDGNSGVVPQADYGVVFTHMDVGIEWNNDRSCHVTQNLDVEFLDNDYDGVSGSHGIYVDIPLNSGEKIRGLSITARGNYSFGSNRAMPYTVEHQNGHDIMRIVVGDADDAFYKGNTMTCRVEYDYITPIHPENKNLLDINAIGYGWVHPVADATVTVTYPTEIAGELTAVFGSQDNTVAVPLENIVYGADGKSITVNVGSLKPFNGVRVRGEMPDGALVSYFDYSDFVPVAIGMFLLLAVIVSMLVFGKDKPISAIVDYYPPRIDGADGRKRHMLPVQMGKIIDDKCSEDDVTSLIFYWASKGYLAIEEKDDETYLIKLKDVDAVTSYEKRMFDKLFEGKSKRDDGTVRVSIGSLKGKFAGSVTAVKTAVDAEYKGKFYKKKFTVLSVAMLIITAIYGLCVGMFSTFKVSFGFVNLAGLLTLIPIAIAGSLGNLLMRNYIKLPSAKRRSFTILLFVATAMLSVAVIFVVPTYVMSLWSKIVFAICFSVSAALSPFLTVRTDSYTEQLNELVGFRDFLRDAEKDRLEALINDDPQYYYAILPYANVLGVSDVWAKKFSDIALEPPTYYHGRNVSVFDVIVLNRLCRSVGSTLTYTPPRTNSGSFSGGRSSSGGGGGSFGGFGGGGGGRW